MAKAKKDYTINFALMYLLHYISMALINSQRQTFLITLGYSLNQRSIIFAAIPAVTILMQLIVGILSDRFKTVKKIIVWLVALSAVFAYLFYSVDLQLYVFYFAIAVISQSLVTAVTDLSDVWVLESEGPSSRKYGFIRAFGSAGWSIGSFLLASIVNAFGYSGLGISILMISVILLLIMFTISDDKSNLSMNEAKEAIKLKDIIELFTSKNYLLAISLVFFINMGVNMAGYITIDKIIELGGDITIIGYRGVIAAGVEVPLMLMGDSIHKRLGSFKMIIIGVTIHCLQFIGYYFATTNAMLLFITAFQFISVPFYQVAIKYLMLKMAPENLKTTGQMTGPAIVNGITGIIYPLICAFIVAKFSINAPFLLAAIFGVIGILITLTLYKTTTKANA